MNVTWILESNVFAERCFDEMLAHLQQRGYRHHVVRIIPFSHELVGAMPGVDGPCVVYGSLGIAKLALGQGWKPGVWTNEKFNSESYAAELGDLFLNQGLFKCRLSEVVSATKERDWPQFFIKPNSDAKDFAGGIVETNEIATWVSQLQDSGLLQDNDLEVVVAPPCGIAREWRTVVVDSRIIAFSLYRNYRKRWDERSIDPEALNVAHRAAAMFRPADVFVVDIAETDKGMKIIEYNTFNSAGLYACDVAAVIDGVSAWVARQA